MSENFQCHDKYAICHNNNIWWVIKPEKKTENTRQKYSRYPCVSCLYCIYRPDVSIKQKNLEYFFSVSVLFKVIVAENQWWVFVCVSYLFCGWTYTKIIVQRGMWVKAQSDYEHLFSGHGLMVLCN